MCCPNWCHLQIYIDNCLFVCGTSLTFWSTHQWALSRLPQGYAFCTSFMPQGRWSYVWDEVPICSSGTPYPLYSTASLSQAHTVSHPVTLYRGLNFFSHRTGRCILPLTLHRKKEGGRDRSLDTGRYRKGGYKIGGAGGGGGSKGKSSFCCY